MSLPIISINESERKKIDISKDIGKSCEEYGFFIIKDHNLKTNTIENVRNLSRKFFNLPLEKKNEISPSWWSRPKRLYPIRN